MADIQVETYFEERLLDGIVDLVEELVADDLGHLTTQYIDAIAPYPEPVRRAMLEAIARVMERTLQDFVHVFLENTNG